MSVRIKENRQIYLVNQTGILVYNTKNRASLQSINECVIILVINDGEMLYFLVILHLKYQQL